MRDSALTHGLPGPQEINSEPQIRCVPLVLYWYMGTGTSNVQCTCTLDQSKGVSPGYRHIGRACAVARVFQSRGDVSIFVEYDMLGILQYLHCSSTTCIRTSQSCIHMLRITLTARHLLVVLV